MNKREVGMKKKAKRRVDERANAKEGELAEAALERASGGTTATDDLNQLNFRVQTFAQDQANATSTANSIMKKASDTQKSIINNLK
jgi:hypothetical protein